MNPVHVANLKPGMRVRYISPSSPQRTKGTVYTITELDESGRYVKHLADNGLDVVMGHVDQYQLVDKIETRPIDPIEPIGGSPRQEVVKALAEFAPKPEPTPAPAAPAVNPAIAKTLQDAQDLSSQLMAFSLAQGQKLANELIRTVQNELDGIRRQTAQILKVQVNDTPIRDLKTQAVPYLKRMLISAKLGKNIMLVGPAGCGKTTAAEQLAQALGVPFHNLTFTAGASETWLFGRQTPNGFVPGSFWLAYKDGGVFLADEFDAGDANLILSINTAIENGHCFNPINGESVKRHKDFVLIAACNTFGKGADGTYTGRNRLDAASLRRFAGSTIAVDYNPEIEKALCPDDKLRETLQSVRTELKRLGSTEIVSTGCIKNAYDLYTNGIPFSEIAESLSLSWPEDLKPVMQKAVKDFGGKSEGKSKSKHGGDEYADAIPF